MVKEKKDNIIGYSQITTGNRVTLPPIIMKKLSLEQSGTVVYIEDYDDIIIRKGVIQSVK